MTISDATGIPRDAEGYLINPDRWSKPIAGAPAAGEDIEPSDGYRVALDFMRDYYDHHHPAPGLRHSIAHLAHRWQSAWSTG